MKKTNTQFLIFCIINAFATLLAGGAIYVLFCKNTYINSFITINAFQNSKSVISLFLRSYFADFLWGYAFCFALMTVIKPIAALIITVLFSAAYEILQFSNLLGGTGDIIDIILYLSASLIAVLIAKKFKGEK